MGWLGLWVNRFLSLKMRNESRNLNKTCGFKAKASEEISFQETVKLKSCINEFSERIAKVQEMLMQGEDRVCTRKVRRFHSCDWSNDPKSYTNPVTFHPSSKQDPQQNFQPPATPSVILKYFKESLSPYEQGEVIEYRKIYYFGMTAKIIRNISSSSNYGFDDERGDYRVVQHDHIKYRYEILGPLGKGAFGQVVKVFDHKNKEPLALKIIKNKSRFTEQAQTEAQILLKLQNSDLKKQVSIVSLKKAFSFRRHSCLLFELLGPSLYSLIKANNFKGLEQSHIKQLAYHVVQALVHTSKQGVIHCDLKPENILVLTHSKFSAKVIDLGSACLKNHKIFNYIQSRFYRAPEVLLGLNYSEAIDVWSLGCILAELLTGSPLFPAQSELELFGCITEVLGLPPPDLVQGSKRHSLFFHSNMQPRPISNSRGHTYQASSTPLKDLLPGASSDLADLIQSIR